MATETTATTSTETEGRKFGFWLFMVGVVIMLAGLLFGYDQGVIAGALEGIQNSFHVSSTMTEVITSWVTLGALFGALFAGYLADRLGRKPTILLAAALFVVGAMLEAFSPGTAVLVAGRLVVGFGVGVASVAAPLYAAEQAPTHLRGRFVSTYQLAITIGIFIAYFVDQQLTNGDMWRVMLGVSAVPGVLLLIAMAPMPESTRWLVGAGRRKDATVALTKVRPDVDVEATLDDIEAAVKAESADRASWGEVFARSVRKPLMVAIGLAVAQQITGINAIIYYADSIFAKAGFATPGRPGGGHHLGHRRGERAGHPHRRRLRRPLRAAAPAALRPRRAWPAASSPWASPSTTWTGSTPRARARADRPPPASSPSSPWWCSSPRSPSRSARWSGP